MLKKLVEKRLLEYGLQKADSHELWGMTYDTYVDYEFSAVLGVSLVSLMRHGENFEVLESAVFLIEDTEVTLNGIDDFFNRAEN